MRILLALSLLALAPTAQAMRYDDSDRESSNVEDRRLCYRPTGERKWGIFPVCGMFTMQGESLNIHDYCSEMAKASYLIPCR